METNTQNELFEKAEKLVEREVIYCVSTLIHELGEDQYMGGQQEIFELWQGPPSIGDYEGTCPKCGEDILLQGEPEDDGETYPCQMCHTDIKYSDLDFEAIEYREVFEHWIVSKYLAEKLEEQGETVVRDFMGMDIWARCATGQSIALDYVIQQIAKGMY